MNYHNNDFPGGIIFTIIFIVIFGAGMTVGSGIAEQDNITKGRNEGIILCSEKPTECKTEYDYLKLKEQLKK
jgi:hypothetical protein